MSAGCYEGQKGGENVNVEDNTPHEQQEQQAENFMLRRNEEKDLHVGDGDVHEQQKEIEIKNVVGDDVGAVAVGSEIVKMDVWSENEPTNKFGEGERQEEQENVKVEFLLTDSEDEDKEVDPADLSLPPPLPVLAQTWGKELKRCGYCKREGHIMQDCHVKERAKETKKDKGSGGTKRQHTCSVKQKEKEMTSDFVVV
jgi:hypothetical protein